MQGSRFIKPFARKLLVIVAGLLIIIAGLYVFWQKNKFSIIKQKIAEAFLAKSDSLYSIQYDSLYYNESTGAAYLNNITILPDTARLRRLTNDTPYAALKIHIRSLSINGMKTKEVINNHRLIGDSIIIDEPVITAYILRKVKRQTKINIEAEKIYREILNRIKLLQVNEVIIRNAEFHAVNFSNYQRQFEIFNTNINLHDVRIDSAQRDDTSRLLFCRNAHFSSSQFLLYNENKLEVKVDNIFFSGSQHRFTMAKALINRFDDKSGDVLPLLNANDLVISGVDNQEVVNNKIIGIDSIFCRQISFYRPPGFPGSTHSNHHLQQKDTLGFRASYGINLHTLYLPQIDLVEPAGTRSPYELGKFSVTINGVVADELLELQDQPGTHIKEIGVNCQNLAYTSNDKLYRNQLTDVRMNSLQKQISIGSVRIMPLWNEESFANKAVTQKDRYDVSLGHVVFSELNFDRLLDKQLMASMLSVSNGSIKIYRDISRPLDGVSKIGNYPQQILHRSDLPIDIRKVVFNDLYVEYREKNSAVGRAGTVRFNHTHIVLENISNMAPVKTDALAEVNTKVLDVVPLSATFRFPAGANNGRFIVHGDIGECDMRKLNEISKPMALLQIDSGFIHSAVFDFTGDDRASSGHFTMKYDHLRVSLLKKDQENSIVKRGFMSFIANSIIHNQNPKNGKLRTCDIQYDRDQYKSFFNLVWKTIFTGLKATVGMPMPKIK